MNDEELRTDLSVVESATFTHKLQVNQQSHKKSVQPLGYIIKPNAQDPYISYESYLRSTSTRTMNGIAKINDPVRSSIEICSGCSLDYQTMKIRGFEKLDRRRLSDPLPLHW